MYFTSLSVKSKIHKQGKYIITFRRKAVKSKNDARKKEYKLWFVVVKEK